MKFAVFFRNLNLGRPPAPGRQQLEQVFLNAGAETAASFLTNGTLVFETSTKANAKKILAHAQTELLDANGFAEFATLRDLVYLQKLVDQEPFVSVDKNSVYECCVTFFAPTIKFGEQTPTSNTKKDVAIIQFTKGEMLSLSYKRGASPGSPNAFAERHFNQPATTRAWNTLVRLVQKFS